MFDIDYIVCSIDKDLKCIPGKHYLMHKEIMIDVSEAEAMRHYYEQLLKGDPTDNIPGVPRVGEVKAGKILEPYSTEEEFQDQVIEQYMGAYDKNWVHYLLANAKLIHLQRDVGDYFSFVDWPMMENLR
jgi:DNA polymerase-1